MQRDWRILVSAALMAVWSVKAGAAVPERSSAMAVGFTMVDPDTRHALVTGEQSVMVAGDGTVRRRATYAATPAGDAPPVAAAAAEEVTVDAGSGALRAYHFEDPATGELVDIQVGGREAQVRYRADADSRLRSDAIPWGASCIPGMVLPDLMVRQWHRLAAGEPVAFELFVPFRLGTMGFSATARHLSGATWTVAVAPRNWLLRPVVPRIEFDFMVRSQGKPTVTAYRGPAAVAIGGEKHRPVVIDFAAR